MRIPFWLIALLFVGYSIWAVRFWCCLQCQCCDGQKPPEETVQTSGVPLFRWNADKPEQDANFQAWKKSLLAQAGQGDTLLITGWYRAGETATGAANLGQARAEALKALMMPPLPESRIKLDAKQVTDSLAEGGPARESAGFSWLKMQLAQEEGAIIEQDNDVTFLFPFNSTEKDKDPAVDAYLKKLVEKHKATKATFRIVGHTDDVGEAEANIKLGMGRAQAIARILQNNGIAASRIKVESKGEAEPVASNSTDDGRHQNRRVVLTTNN